MNRRALTLLLLATPLPLAIAFQAPADDGVPAVGSPGGPSRELSDAELVVWLRGRALFDHPFH